MHEIFEYIAIYPEREREQSRLTTHPKTATVRSSAWQSLPVHDLVKHNGTQLPTRGATIHGIHNH
jgi:hypothetical protein